MSEIELKIPLNENAFTRIKNIIEKNDTDNIRFSKAEKILKADEYFSRFLSRDERKQNNEFEVIRIRTETIEEKTKSYFTTKRKTLKDGFEVNDEKETFIENPAVLKNFLLESGFEVWFSKKKEAVSTVCTLKNFSFHIELEKVNDLLYVEIENTDSRIENTDAVMERFKELVSLLCLDISKRDSRPWPAILA